MPKKYSKELVGVPELQEGESPSSWLTRAALSQGVSIKELAEYFEIPLRGDCDLIFVGANVRRIAGLCGIPFDSFQLNRQMFGGVRKLDVTGKRYLLFHDALPRYRFCPSCIHLQRVKYFPIHWRFNAWRWCPQHDCMMEDACPHCSSVVVLPRNMLEAGIDRSGVGTLARCLNCGKALWTRHNDSRMTLDADLLTPWERVVMRNGRALLAALLTKRVIFGERTFTTAALRRIEKRGLLPHRHFHLDAAEIRRRSEVARSITGPTLPRGMFFGLGRF